MQKIIMIIVATLFATFSFADEPTKPSFTDDMMFSVTLEKGMETELQYGYFYATKPITDKLSTTYGATWDIDAEGKQLIDLSSQTINISYQINDNLSVYALTDLNDKFERSETWLGSTYTW
jgi:hypothetical protein